MTYYSARYMDGRSSQIHQVELSITEQSVIILKDSGELAIWPYSKTYVKDDWNNATGVILGMRDDSDAGLVIQDNPVFLKIQSKLSRRNQTTYIIPTNLKHLLGLTIIAVIAGILLFPLLGHISTFLTYLVPYSLEQKLGRVILTEMADEFEPCDDSIALGNLKKITDRLMNGADKKDIRPILHLYQSDTSNAFSLPGGHIAILSGFLKEAETENEIAGVLAHEMGHMAKRDSLEAFVESQGMSLIINLIGSSGSYGGMAEFASVMKSLHYSRQKEFAADAFATDLVVKAGYTPKGLSAFLNRSNSNDDTESSIMKYLEFVSTHPDTTERIKRIEKSLQPSSKIKNSLTLSEFKRLQAACQTQEIKE